MSLMSASGGSLTGAIEAAIVEALGQDASAEVQGTGGHFTVRAVSVAFEGKGLLAKQRLVMRALAPFMAGADAPVHAIDHLETLTPDEDT
jgi:acid stress-induced BolA-like protein IbaG/YrbA